MAWSWMRPHLAISIVALSLTNGCGKDETDFADLDGQIGVVPGEFNLRLAQAYRDRIDGLEDQVNRVVPGLTAQLTRRFGAASDTIDAQGTRLADLLKIKLPGTDSEFLNQRIFKELSRLSGDAGAYFDLIDTEKFLKNSVYAPPASGENGYDPELARQYYLEMIRWQEAVADVSDTQLATAAPVVVAVLDTGVLGTHQDIADVLWSNSDSAVGYDAVRGQALSKGTATDANGHGTHVAGIIGGRGRNQAGIHGVGFLPRPAGATPATTSITELMPIRVLNDQGSGTSDMITRGIKWAVDEHWRQKEADATRQRQKLILNMSLGGPFEAQGYDFKKGADGAYVFEDDVINYATSRGDVLVIVAAGNESCGIGGACDLYGESVRETYYYPCSYKNVLCVAATTHADRLAGFSNRLGSVGLAAPGYQIISTLPSSADAYGYYSGTSQATPVTSGAAAVLWSLYADDFSAADIKAILQKASARVAAVTGQVSSGFGRLDLKAAMAYAAELKAQGKKPAELDPSASIIATAANSPSNPPPAGDIDPDAASPHAVADGSGGLGMGSGQGCAVVAQARLNSGAAACLALLLPLLFSLWWRPGSKRARS